MNLFTRRIAFVYPRLKVSHLNDNFTGAIISNAAEHVGLGMRPYYWYWITWEETWDHKTDLCAPPPSEEIGHFTLVYLFLGNSPPRYFKANITSSSHARQHTKRKILSSPKYDYQFLHEAASPMSHGDSSCFWSALLPKAELAAK